MYQLAGLSLSIAIGICLLAQFILCARTQKIAFPDKLCVADGLMVLNTLFVLVFIIPCVPNVSLLEIL